MGIRDILTRSGRDRLTRPATMLPISSPYGSTVELPQLVVSDLMPDGAEQLPLNRATAMQVPAVSKARNLLVSTVAKFPLVALAVDAQGVETITTSKYPWLHRTNGSVAPYERMAWTVDDLIFYGCSLWLLDRGAPEGTDGRRPILNAEWCPYDAWSIEERDGQLRVVVDGVPIAEDRYMLINSPFEGLLTLGARTLRGARDIEDSWVGRARNPIPAIDLHRTDDDSLTDDEVKAYVKAWSEARTKPNGAVGSTPAGIELRVHGAVDPALMVEGRNAIRTDVGSFLNVRASMLDGTSGIDSLTYTTKDGERNSFYEFDLPFWVDPIAARLSLDDIVPRGTRVRFDMYQAYNAPAATGPQMED